MNNLPEKSTNLIHGYTFPENEAAMIRANPKENSTAVSVRTVTSDQIKEILQSIGVPLDKIPRYDATVQDVILVCIHTAIQRLGHNKKHSQDVKFTCDEIYKWVKSYKYSLSVQELILAIQLGSQGEYNEDVVYVSATNAIRWVKTYLNRREIVFKTLSVAKEKEALTGSEIERKEKFIDYWERFPAMVRDEFLFYNANGTTSESVARIITGLERIGFKSNGKGFLSELIPVETKQEWKEEIEKRLKPEPVTKTITTYNAETDKHEHTKHTLEPQKIDVVLFGDEVIAECKRRALIHWFDGVVMVEVDVIKQLCDKAVKRALKRN